jgi:hypothetical protein
MERRAPDPLAYETGKKYFYEQQQKQQQVYEEQQDQRKTTPNAPGFLKQYQGPIFALHALVLGFLILMLIRVYLRRGWNRLKYGPKNE